MGSLGAFLARGPLIFGCHLFKAFNELRHLFEAFNELVQLLFVLPEDVDQHIQDIYLLSV